MSYFEWVQDVGWFFWTETEVRRKLKNIMYSSFERVWRLSKDEAFGKIKGKDLRLISMTASLQRLEKAMKLRGQAW